MQRQMVVAKYREDVSWLRLFPINTIVYNKSPRTKLPSAPHLKHVNLPNNPTGREAHTYILHIVNHYYKLAEWTLFLQGDPFPHYNITQEIIRHKPTDTQPLSFIDEQGYKIWIEKQSLSNKWGPFPTVLHRQSPLPISLFANISDHYWREVRWRTIFGNANPPQRFVYGYGAQFIVPRWRIQQRPLEFYENILNRLVAYSLPDNMDAWFLEQVWLYIFGDTHPGGFPDRLLGLPARCMA